MVADAEGSATVAAVAIMSETRLLCLPDESDYGKSQLFPKVI